MNEKGVRWTAGEPFLWFGIWYCVVQGSKVPRAGDYEDLKLMWYIEDEWRAVEMAHLALHSDFFVCNEDGLYPPRFDLRGGGMVFDMVRTAVTSGFRKATSTIMAESANARRMRK